MPRHKLGHYKAPRKGAAYSGARARRQKDPYERYLNLRKDNIEAIKEAQDLPLDISGLATYPEEI